jgi:hypothetical protein
LNRSNFQEARQVAKKPAKKKFTKGEIAGLKKRALKLWRTDNSHAMELGRALVAVREALRSQHGAFKEWWEDNRLSQSRVSYCMDLASEKLAKRKKKAKAKAAEDIKVAQAVKAVSKKLNGLFLACTRRDDPLAVPIPDEFAAVLYATLNEVASFSGWKLNRPECKKAATDYETALKNLITIASRPDDKAAGASA